MDKINIKLLIFLVIFLMSSVGMAFYKPDTAQAAALTGEQIKILAALGDGREPSVPGKDLTSAQIAASKNARSYCPDDAPGEKCKIIYVAIYLGEKIPLSDEEINDVGQSNVVIQEARTERRKDFREIPRAVCQTMVNTAQGSDHLGVAFKNLRNQDKGKAVNACVRGINFSLIDFSSGCQNAFGGRQANDIEYIACLTGNSMGDQHLFTTGEARRFAQGSDTTPPPSDDSEGAGGEGQGTEEIKCEASAPTISWFICPVIEFGANFTNWFFDSFLRPLLEDVPVSLNPEDGSFQAWQGFRLLANIMLVASMLAIVYAQARGDQ